MPEPEALAQWNRHPTGTKHREREGEREGGAQWERDREVQQERKRRGEQERMEGRE